MIYDVTIDGSLYRLDMSPKDGQWHCSVDNSGVQVDAILVRPNELSLIIDGASYAARREKTPQGTYLWIDSLRYTAEVSDPRSLQSRRSASGSAEGSKRVFAPMPGRVVRVLVKEHDAVQAGQGVVVVEAMKMQNELKSPKEGTVQKILVAEGASVNAGEVLLVVE